MQARQSVPAPTPRLTTAIPARFVAARARVLAILGRWDATIAARRLAPGVAR